MKKKSRKFIKKKLFKKTSLPKKKIYIKNQNTPYGVFFVFMT